MQVFNILISILRGKFTAVLIGSAGLGVMDMFVRTSDLLEKSTNGGVHISAVRRISELYEQGEKARLQRYVCLVRTWIFLAALLGFFVTLLAAPLLSRMINSPYADTLTCALLAPIVAALTLSGGELAVLKGVRRLKSIAAISACGALATLLIAVLFYALLGLRGVICVLLLTHVLLLCFYLRSTSRIFPYSIRPASWRFLKNGIPMLRLGLAFVVAGVVMAGAELAVRAFINDRASIEEVGLYAAGFTLTVTYARIVLTSLDSDFYPRLSAICKECVRANVAINRQIDVCVLLMTPFLLAFALILPLAIRILLTSEFLSVIPMVLGALMYMFFKAVYTPIAYLPLAHGDSKFFLTMESIYALDFVVLVLVGYSSWGLFGAGLALSLANFLDLIFLSTVYGKRYGFRFEKETLLRTLLQMFLLAAGLLCIANEGAWLKYGGGGCALLLSVYLAWDLLKKETQFVERIKRLIKKDKR